MNKMEYSLKDKIKGKIKGISKKNQRENVQKSQKLPLDFVHDSKLNRNF